MRRGEAKSVTPSSMSIATPSAKSVAAKLPCPSLPRRVGGGCRREEEKVRWRQRRWREDGRGGADDGVATNGGREEVRGEGIG